MPSRARAFDLSQTRVLVVDDDQLSTDILKQILGGFRVRQISECSSPHEAQALVARQPFDLLLIDGEMPEQSGAELTRHIRSRTEEPNFTAPIMIVTAMAQPSAVMRARDNGADMIVVKPVSPAVLLSRIEWMARRERQFVVSDDYCGPDRRFKRGPPPPGVEERRADALALTSGAGREMSQDELDALFG